jgi:hypothetical protein
MVLSKDDAVRNAISGVKHNKSNQIINRLATKEFGDIIGVISIRKSKDRQHNGQKTKG